MGIPADLRSYGSVDLMRTFFDEYGGTIIEAICASLVIYLITSMLRPSSMLNTFFPSVELPDGERIVTLHDLLLEIFRTLMP